MRDKSRSQYFLFRHFKTVPTIGQAAVIALLFIVVFLLAWLAQQMGLWPESWFANFDGVGD